MSTQELVYNLPKLKSRSLKRKFSAHKLKAQRYAKAKMRKTRSKAIAYWRRQYFLTTAKADLSFSIARNEDIFIAATIIATLTGYSFGTKAADLVLLFFQTAYQASSISGASMFFLTLAAMGTLSVLLGWILAFMMNLQSLAIMEGATGKRLRSVRSTLRNSLRNTTRVATAWLLIAAMVSAPLLVAAISAYTYITVAAMSMKEVLLFAPHAALITGIITLVVLLQYSLAPYVALFEPEQPIRQTLKRSRQLVQRRGRIFLLSFYLVLITTLSAVYGIAKLFEHVFGVPIAITLSLGGIATLMFANGILVMLYRKRKLARKY